MTIKELREQQIWIDCDQALTGEEMDKKVIELFSQFKSELCKAQRENCTNSINPDEVNGIKHRVNVYNTPEP